MFGECGGECLEEEFLVDELYVVVMVGEDVEGYVE